LLRPRGRRGRWSRRGRRPAGRRGDEGRRRRRRRRHVELGQAQISADVVEGGEGPLPGDELGHELKSFIETTQNVEHQSAILDGLAKISQAVGHVLHLPAVFVDGESALAELAEFGVKKHGAGFAVVEELLLQAKPRSTSGDAVAFIDDVEKVGGDGVEDPRDDDVIHTSPGGIVEANVVSENMVPESKSTEDEEDVATPLRVVGRLQVKNDGDRILDVLQGRSLAVQASDGRGFGGHGAVVVLVVGRIFSAEGLGSNPIAESGGLLFKGGGLRPLGLKGGGGGADALLSSSGGLEERHLIQELLAALGIRRAQRGRLGFQLFGGGEGFITKRSRGGGGGDAGAGVSGHGEGGSGGDGRGGRGATRAAAEEVGAARGERGDWETREARGKAEAEEKGGKAGRGTISLLIP
jgi:hypothetical protein